MDILVATVEEDIDAATEALRIYDKLVERDIPWKELKESLVELEKYRKDFSSENALFIGEIKTYMMDGIDAHFQASQYIYEWLSLVVSHLKLYIALFNGHDARKAVTQKRLLIDMLDSGLTQVRAAQSKLGNSSSSFNSAGERLIELRSEDWQKKEKLVSTLKWSNEKYVHSVLGEMSVITNFFDKLDKNIKKATQNMVDAKKELREKIQSISDLIEQTQEALPFVSLAERLDLRDMIIQSAQNLIEKCEEYQVRHTEKTH